MLAPTLASAAEAGTGTIEGTVTEAEGAKAPIEDTIVYATSVDYETFESATTNEFGEYTIDLPAGEYHLEFSGEVCEPETACTHPYIRQYYDGQTEYDDAEIVEVESEEPTEADAALELGGVISGEVKNVAGAPVSSTLVCASSESTGSDECATTNGGDYTIEGLASANDYIVYFSGEVCPGEGGCATPYLSQYYDGSPSYSSPQTETVAVTAPETTEEIDATLAEGGKIEGVVTNAALSKAAIAGMEVCATPTTSSESVYERCA
jgi:hypothetical protein